MERRHQPYSLPRLARDKKPASATGCPSFVDFSGKVQPSRIAKGSGIFFGHLTAHEFTQRKRRCRMEQPSDDTFAQGWVRTAEYPTLVSPLLHGVPKSEHRGGASCAVMRNPARALGPRLHWQLAATPSQSAPGALIHSSSIGSAYGTEPMLGWSCFVGSGP